MNTDIRQIADKDECTDSAILLFGPFALHRSRQLLLKDDREVRIGSRAFGLLVDLVERAGQLRTRAQLEARVWPCSIVEETSLRVHMSALRRALGDGRDGARYIENIPGCGYSFIGTVTRCADHHGTPATTTAPMDSQLVGRADALRFLLERCARVRLLSIVGPGGIGKTVLAMAVAERLQGRFEDGVARVDLASAGDGAGVVDLVAATAGIRLPPSGREAALCAALAPRRMLLVLDNCDRAVDGAAALAIALLRHTSGIHVLATTREPLDVQGERVHWLETLPAPALAPRDPNEALCYPAVALFVERAKSHDHRFFLDAGNVADICRLCRCLDGIPLAIELAAARVEALGVAGLADSIGELLGLLTRARRTALPRHRTMEATLAWSYELLDAQERAVLCRSSIFRAAFSIEAAREVCTGGDIDGETVARCVESLAAKSLLARKAEGNNVLYRQLLLTRSYVCGKLADGEREHMAARHASHVAALLALSPGAVAAQAPLPWVDAHGRCMEDVRAALDWAFGPQGERALGIAMTPNLVHTLRFLGMPDDFQRHLLLALDQRGAPPMTPDAAISVYAALAVLGAYSHTGADLMREIHTRLHALQSRVASPALRLQALISMGAMCFAMSETDDMIRIAHALNALARQEDNPAYDLLADRLESSARHFRGEHAAAEALCHRVLASALPASSFGASCLLPSSIGARWHLARIAWIQGKADLAARLAHEALVYAEQSHSLALCQTLVVVALPVALWRGDGALAAQLASRLASLGDAGRGEYWREWARAYGALAIPRSEASAATLVRPEALAPIAQDILATIGEDMLCDATLARAEAGMIDWCAPEIWRVRGERLLRRSGKGRAAAWALFERALALARSQQALAWELRIACSMLRCTAGTPGAARARARLEEVLERFREGRDTADCRAASALLG